MVLRDKQGLSPNWTVFTLDHTKPLRVWQTTAEQRHEQ